VTIHPISDYLTKKDIPCLAMDKHDFLLVYEDYALSQDPVWNTALGAMG
jgi:hypothetical protein